MGPDLFMRLVLDFAQCKARVTTLRKYLLRLSDVQQRTEFGLKPTALMIIPAPLVTHNENY